jgi:6-phosphogluconolactonase
MVIDTPMKKKNFVFAGSKVPQDEDGISIWALNQDSGHLEYFSAFKGIDSPTFLAVHPTGRFLYAVSETEKTEGKPGGRVFAFRLTGFMGDQTEQPRLELINSIRSIGAYPCHLSIDADKNQLIVSNYGDGILTVARILSDGSLGEIVQEIRYAGQGKDTIRQECSHIHSSLISDTDDHVYVADLGLDRVYHYVKDDLDSLLTTTSSLFLEVPPGSGPRHATFSHDHRFLYLVEELSNEISVCSIDSADGSLILVDTLSTLPDSHKGVNLAADIHLSPDGGFLYVSNRGHDSIAIFRVDPISTGRLQVVGWVPVQGMSPRNFAIDDSGRWLIAANTESDSLVTFSIDASTGFLTPTYKSDVRKPMCVLFNSPRS